MSGFKVGDTVTTTVHMIGGRSAEVSGPVVEIRMSRKAPERVVAYVVDATDAGYGKLSVEVAKARPAACTVTGERNCTSRTCELHYMDAPLRLDPLSSP